MHICFSIMKFFDNAIHTLNALGISKQLFVMVSRLHWIYLPLILIFHSTVGQPRLFEVLEDQANLHLIPDCLAHKVKSCQNVKLNVDLVRNSDQVHFHDGSVLTLSQSLHDLESSHVRYFEGPEGQHATVTFHGETSFSANLATKDGNMINIHPIGNNQHILVELESHNEEENANKEVQIPDLVELNRSNSKEDLGLSNDTQTMVTYSVTVYFTEAFANVTSDVPSFVKQAIAETNLGYVNSKIPLKLKLHCLIKAKGLAEVSGMEEMVHNFLDYKNYKPDLLRLSADTALLLVSNVGACGGAISNNVDAPVGVIGKGCALGYYSFGHELAHMFGCTHNEETKSIAHYPYGYGKLINPPVNSGLRTLLAYSSEGYGRRINYFSGPQVVYNKIVTGDTRHDNARVMREKRFIISQIGDESQACPLDGETNIATRSACEDAVGAEKCLRKKKKGKCDTWKTRCVKTCGQC